MIGKVGPLRGPMIISDRQYQQLMKRHSESGSISNAAMKAGMDRKTARRYLKTKQGPKELAVKHTWKTRDDPVVAIWTEAQRWLQDSPELEAKALFEHLALEAGEKVDGRALRTFQRRVLEWRRHRGPQREVCFQQIRQPAQSMQFDWTHADELGVTIAGQPYSHLLAHSMLPYSNWEWAIPCQSESASSLLAGVQEAYWTLGGLTIELQTDQSSTATHQLKRYSPERGFNQRYLGFCQYLGVKPRTIAVGCPNQNGDIESAQGHLKRRLKQHLLLRRSRDFGSVTQYAAFVAQVCQSINKLRAQKLSEELGHLKALPVTRFPEYELSSARVSVFSTARVQGSAYSVPSRLIGAIVQAQFNESEVVFLLHGQEVARYPRARNHLPKIDYRHVIDSLLRKPGAFERYVYREELYPSAVFRQAYDRLRFDDERTASRQYLLILKLATELGEAIVGAGIGAVLRDGELPLAGKLEQILRQKPAIAPSSLAAFQPELDSYDQLIEEVSS